MKYMIALLLAACPVLASAAPNNDKAAVQAVIARYYSGLTLNQYGVASPCRTICTVCGFVALS